MRIVAFWPAVSAGGAFEHPRVVFGEGGSLRGDGAGESGAVAGDDVELSFADDGPSGVLEGGSGEVVGVEELSLLEEVGFG